MGKQRNRAQKGDHIFMLKDRSNTNFKKIFNRQRIVGGVQAATNSWPWIVRLKVQPGWGNKGSEACAGTIIDDKTIVTAAYLGCPIFLFYIFTVKN